MSKPKPFDDLKEAIKDVVEMYEQRMNGLSIERLSAGIEHLRDVYALYFVEPEDDTEFQNWRKES